MFSLDLKMAIVKSTLEQNNHRIAQIKFSWLMSLPFGRASLDQGMRSSAALFFLFTSTRLFIQEFVARGAVTLITNSLVLADVGAATVVVCTLIQACRDRVAAEERAGMAERKQWKIKQRVEYCSNKFQQVFRQNNFGNTRTRWTGRQSHGLVCMDSLNHPASKDIFVLSVYINNSSLCVILVCSTTASLS